MLLVVVAVVIVAGVAVVAMGRGGELAKFTADVRPLDADIETAADVALLRPPASMWGYDKRATDDALNAVAQTVTERDVEIAVLRQQLADLRGPARRRRAGAPGSPGQAQPAGQPGAQGDQPGAQGEMPGTERWSAWERSDQSRPEAPDPEEDSE